MLGLRLRTWGVFDPKVILLWDIVTTRREALTSRRCLFGMVEQSASGTSSEQLAVQFDLI